MALNKVNIEFLRKQMDKVLTDIEKLKDANRREMKYTNGESLTMIESVVALLMFVNRDQRTRIQEKSLSMSYAVSVMLRDNSSERCRYKCYNWVKQNRESTILDGSKSIKKIIE